MLCECAEFRVDPPTKGSEGRLADLPVREELRSTRGARGVCVCESVQLNIGVQSARSLLDTFAPLAASFEQ